MGRVVVTNFTSIDGVVQSPLSPEEDPSGGFDRGGWVPPHSDDEVDAFMSSTTVGAAGLLLGAGSYRILADAWSTADDGVEAVAAMNRMPKHVLSSTLDELAWTNSHRLRGPLPDAVGDLKERTDGDLLVLGSPQLVRGLAEHDLVDEYRLLVFPVVLGAGKRMFDADTLAAGFGLVDHLVSPSGVVVLTYRRERG